MGIWESFRRFSTGQGERRRGSQKGAKKQQGDASPFLRPRNLQIERFEDRVLLAITGPKLAAVIPNASDILNEGEVLNIAPRELLLRFAEGQRIDPAAGNLSQIQVVRAGGDGTFGNGNDVVVDIGWAGRNDAAGAANEVTVRFASTLPDDQYQIVVGTNFKNLDGETYDDSDTSGADTQTLAFRLDLGAQVTAVVPQPITRNATSGVLEQARNVIEVYFNQDQLALASAQNPNFYQLILTGETATTDDDVVVTPSSVTYAYDSVNGGKAVLTFGNSGTDLADFGTGAFRLRIGNSYVDQQFTTRRITAAESGTSFYTAEDLSAQQVFPSNHAFGQGSSAQSLIISAEIDKLHYNLEWPGALDEPGQRDLPNQPALNPEDHASGADQNDGIPVMTYYFPDVYGTDPVTGGQLRSAITPAQKQRTREIFEIYGKYLGVKFQEVAGDQRGGSYAIVTGDIKAIDATYPNGPTGPGGIANGHTALMNYTVNWGSSEFGGAWFQTALHEIGHLLGLNHSYDLPAFTVMGSSEDATTTTGSFEPVFPGDYDIVHGQRIWRPDSTDIDLYKFTLDQAGMFSAEIMAERLGVSSTLDAQVTLYEQYTTTETITVLEGGVETQKSFPVTRYRVIARNDNYYSDDSYLEMYLNQGTYFVGVSASGNNQYDPNIDSSGIGGVSDGVYELRVNFKPGGVNPDDPNTFKGNGTTHLTDTNQTLFDGDADGVPGGVYDYWFNVQDDAVIPSTPGRTQPTTIYVDKVAQAAGANGTIAHPYNEIDRAIAVAKPGDIVRIVGNNFGNDTGAQGNLTDNRPYEIGRNSSNTPLADGDKLEVPKGVTVVFDAGAVVKLTKANIDVGSSSMNLDRSLGSLQVLGIPGRPVYFTSFYDETLGADGEVGRDTVGAAGDWGGLVFRNQVDYDFIAAYDPKNAATTPPRTVLETQGIFLNYVNHADIRYGGGKVMVNGVESVYDPIHMVEARPTITYNTITHSADAALSGDPNTFADTKYENWDIANPFTTDYERIGPFVRNNMLVDNSINGMYIRVTTPAGQATIKQEVAARWDDWDVVHVVSQNLFLNGTPGGAFIPEATTILRLTDSHTIQAVAATEDANRNGLLDSGEDLNHNGRLDTIDDGQYFSLFDGATEIAFEFDRPLGQVGYGVTAGRERIEYLVSDTAADIAEKVAAKIHELYVAKRLKIDAEVHGDTVTLLTDGPTLRAEGFGAPEARLDARLKVDPGLIVKLGSSRIETEMGAQLIAEGRKGSTDGAQGYKVVFTSIYDNRYGAGGDFATIEETSAKQAAAGDWGGLNFGPVSEASIDQAVIAYAGGIVAIEGGFAQFDPVEIRQATARIANTRFEYNGAGSAGDRNGRGFITPATIYVRGAQPVIAGNDFLNNAGHVVSVDVNSLKATTVPDWGRTTGALDAFDAYIDNHGPLVRENRITGNLTTGINGMEVRGGNLTTESIWDDTDIVHLLYTEVIVPNFEHIGGLRLQSSAKESLVVKLQGANAGFTADGVAYENDNRIGGILQIVGTPGHPVVLTSLSDDSAGAGFDLRDRPQFDTNNNGASIGTPSSWRSVKLTQYSNDRNVAVINEQELTSDLGETSSGQIVDPNANPQTAEALGQLAPEEKAGDDNLRLGFEVHGNIRFDATADVDVYSFSATAGTEVWIDLDWSTFALDAVVELIDADGNVLARSDNSVDEQATDSPYGESQYLTSGNGTTVRTMDRDPWGQPNGDTTYTSDTADQYTMNPRDAGMRVVLPGDDSNVRTYYVRVRSELAIGDLTEANVGDRFQVADGAGLTVQFEFTNDPGFSNPDYVGVVIPVGASKQQIADALVAAIAQAKLRYGLQCEARKLLSGDVALDGVHLKFNPLASGLAALANTSGKYQLQVRLRETQEIAGSTVRYADIRYATTGIEVLGLPAHSPLQGEIAETTSVSNNVFGNAQDIGNLLQSDEGTISVAGYLSSNSDIDWYRMGLDLEGIQSIGGVNDRGGIWATIFDIDYADGLAGADLAMFVFDASGRLLFTSDSSNIADDRPEPIPGATIEDLSRGSVGGGDPFIGTAFLSEGNDTTYYIAITSTLNVPSELLDTSPYTRREPLNSVNRVATEHFLPTNPLTGEPIDERPYTYPNYNDPEFLGQRLTPIVNEFNLSDVIMYVNTGADLYTINPFSGQFETEVTPFPGGYLPNWSGTNYYNDIAMSNDGRLMTLTAGSRSAGGVQDPNCVRLDTGDARTAVSTQSTGITVYRLVNNGLVEDPGNEIEFEALAHDPRTIGAVGTTTNGSRVRTMLAVGSATETGVVQYGHNLVYLLDQNGNGINHPSIVSGAVAGGARVTSDIVPVGQFYTSPTIIAMDATQTQGPYSNPQLNYQQADMRGGESFTINDDHWVATFSSTATVASLNNDVFSVGGRTFAFDDLAVNGSPTGSQVLVTINSAAGGDTIATVAAKLAAAINSETNAEATPYTDPGTGNVEVHIGGTIRSGQEPRFSGGTPAEMSVQYRTGAPFVFELDFGVEVLTPAATPSVLRDGQTFTLQATTGEVYQFEFDSGRVLQVNNRNLLEGDVITVEAGGVNHTFVFDDQNVVGTPAAADYTIVVDSSWMTTAQVADAVAREISRDLAGHAVSATAVNSRISLMGETMVSYNDLEGSTAEVAVQGEYGLNDPSKTAVNFEESMVGAEFAAAFEAVVNNTGTIEASYAYRAPGANGSNPGDRISFSGLLPVGTGNQTSFAGTPNWTYQTGTADGAATAGRIPIALKATDNATEVAAKIAAAINDPAIPLFVNAAASGGNVELTQIKASSVTGLVGSASAVTAPSLNFEGDGPGGNVTGLAYLPDPAYPNNPDMSRLFAVTDTGGLYEVTGWQSGWGFTPVNPQGSYNYIRRNIGQGPQLTFITNLTYDTQQIAFSGLTAGPQNVENAKYSQMLFATDESGHLYAMDTNGDLQPIFSNSAERVQLTRDMDDNSMADVRGVTFSPIDYNLWHMTSNRWADQGHGVLETPDATRNSNFFPTVSPVPGDYSMYFGLEDPNRGTVVNQDLLTGLYKDVQPGAEYFDRTHNSTIGVNEAYGSYNLPGGAHGSFTTNTFSLQGYSSLDKPVLYFNYYAETEGSLDYDGARVYVSNDGAHWDLIATNTDTDDGTMNAFQRGIEREMQTPVQPDRIIDEIVDSNGFQQGTWRQARVDLSQYAGLANLQLRFDFSTASDMGVGDDRRYLTSVPADWLKDGDYFLIDNQRFEFDLGYALQLPNTAGATISDGEWFQIDDGVGHVVRFEFDKNGSVTQTDTLRQIVIADTDNTAQVAQAILDAIQGAKTNPAYSLDIATFLDDALDQDAFGAQVGIRIFLTRAVNVTQGVSDSADLGADMKILGSRPGTVSSGIRVPLTGDMTREQVAEVITQVVNQRFRRQADINDNNAATGRINNLTDPDRIQAIAPGSLDGTAFTVRAVTQRGEYRTVNFIFADTGLGPYVYDATTVIVDLQNAQNADDVATAIAEAITAAAKGLPELNLTATAAADIVTLTGPVSFFGGGTSGLTLLNVDPVVKLDTQEGFLMNLLEHSSTYWGRLGYSYDEPQQNPASILQSLRGDHPEWKDYTPNDSRPSDRYHLFERGQDNRHEGFYVDDIIIGFAERGEMVTGADAGGHDTSFQFNRTPNLDDGEKPVISTGPYQLEVRTGTTYGEYQGAGPYAKTNITQTFDTNDRLAEGYTLTIPPASQIYHGQAFELYDGLNRLTFVFLDQALRGGAGDGNVAIYFNSTQDGGDLSVAVAQAINAAQQAGKLDITAKFIQDRGCNLIDLTGAVGFRNVHLAGATHVVDVGAEYYSVKGFDAGDRNLERLKGQIILESNQIRHSGDYGIYVAPVRDGWKNYDPQTPHPGSGRSLNTPNNLVPGILIENNLVAFTGTGLSFGGTGADDPGTGIYFSGSTGQPTGAVPFGRIVNNTIYGLLDNPLGTGIDILNNASPTVINNIVANVQQSIVVDSSSRTAGTVTGYNLYQNVGDRAVGSYNNSEWVVSTSSPLFVNPALENFYLAPGEDINGNKILDGREDTNNNGILDPGEDLNGNGILDYGEDLNRNNAIDYNWAIDSSLDSLEERQGYFNSVLNPIGIPESPIIAPDRDLYGQLRKDDRSSPDSGAGLSVKKDRGAIDRVDFEGPRAVLDEPSGADSYGVVVVTGTTPSLFKIQLLDNGIGIDDRTVTTEMVDVYQDGVLLTDGIEYFFEYNQTNDEIYLRPTVGIWTSGSVYLVQLDNNHNQRMDTTPAITDLAGNLLQPNQPNNTTQFTINLAVDFGDAPAPYPSSLKENGARHVITGSYLGAKPTSEQDARPDNSDVDDGIKFTSVLVAGGWATVEVTATGPGILRGWIDYLGNGNWTDADDLIQFEDPTAPGQLVTSVALQAGTTTLRIKVPDSVTPGETFARFRFGSQAGLGPTGLALDGEVEDYKVTIVEFLQDFGDAAAKINLNDLTYTATVGANAARHRLEVTPNDGLHLGANVDDESDGQPNAAATGDDATGTVNDEDGLVNLSSLLLVPDKPATFQVQVTLPKDALPGYTAYLQGWIDYNDDGIFDPGEQICANQEVTASGTYPVSFTVSQTALKQQVFARLRLSTSPGLGPTGIAAGDVVPDGEVEDYLVSIIPAPQDYGDAPGSQTLRADNGARHTIVDGFYLGTIAPDPENDGQPNATATGDDANGDDEDGVTFGPLLAGRQGTVKVVATIPDSNPAYLDAWMDFNNDGDFDDLGEKLVFLNYTGVQAGENELTFNVPETLPNGQVLTTRNVAARFRLSHTENLGPTTPATDEQGPEGEVEDYMVDITAGESSISGYAFHDLNGDGTWQSTPAEVGLMAVPTPQRQGAGAGQRVLSGTDNGSVWQSLGFSFDYFGARYAGCYINANGSVSFDAPVTDGTPAESDTAMIAPFWSDVDTTTIGSVNVQNGVSSRGNRFIQIDWYGVGHTVPAGDTADSRTDTFSLYIENDPNGDIVAFFYDTMNWATPTTGGFGGATAPWIGFDPGVGESFVSYAQPTTQTELNALRSAGSVPTYAFRTDPTTGKLVGQEPGLAGVTIYLDLDGIPGYSAGDKVTTTDATGHYQFSGLFPNNTYLVGEVPPQDPNWELTTPDSYTHEFHDTNEQATGYNFGNRHISRLSVEDVVVTEGNSGTTQVEVTLDLTDTYGGPVTVNYSTQDGTATVGNHDYQPASGSFTIPAHGMPAPVWTKQTLTKDAGNDFSYQVAGNLVLWEGYDGHDRELFLYDGAEVHQLTSNAVDDRYATIVPGTGGAWTVYWSQFDGNDYEIRAKQYSGTGTPEAAPEIALTNNSFDDKSPQASDTFVTWLGTTTNGSEVFVAKAGGTAVWQLTKNNRSDYEPQISGSCVVWSGGTGANQEIYLWDGSTWTDTTTDPSSYIQPLTNNSWLDQWPRIDGNLVVWEGFDGEDSEIFMYQIGGNLAPVQVTNDADGTADTQPQVSGNMIVWTRTSGGSSGSEIAYYDASNWYDTANQVPFAWYNLLTYNSVADEAPRICDNHVVWHRQVGSSPVNYDVFYLDLATWSIETNLSNALAYDWYPQVSDEYVVWRNYNGTDYEIVIAHQTQPTVKAKLTLQINGDTNIELDESFFVNFTSADGANLIDNQAKVTILNDDGQMDYGDAPSGYPTRLAENGARHVVKPGMSLGSRVDSESDGQPSAQATGDDSQQYDDEDGVVFNTALASGTVAQITVTASLPAGVQAGYLDAWIDFNGDGRWTDSEKLVFNNYTSLQAGSNVLTFNVPTTAKAGTTAARFRFSSTGGLAPTGTTLDGEVEDYMVSIAKGTSLVVDNRTLTVTGTDLDDVFSVTTGAVVEVTLNGERAQFDAASLDRIIFDGKGGRNQATVIGTTADETIVASPGSATLTRTDLEVVLSNAQIISIDGNGGNDQATITGTDADESALTGPQWATLTSGTNRVAVSHVPTIVVDGAGGSDVISMFDSTGDDTVDVKSGTFTMTDATPGTPKSYSIEAKNFEAGVAYARAGGNDTANLQGTTGNDYYEGTPESGMLVTPAFRYRATGFDQLIVDGEGGQDAARLDDSQGNDTFEARPQDGWSSLSGPNYSHRLNDFQSIDVYGSRGNDTALLHGTSGVTTFTGTPSQAMLVTEGFTARVSHFNSVEAFAGTGTNIAYLLGSLGNDRFVGSNAQSRLSGVGYELIAQGFDRVLAHGGLGGYDTAELNGSSGADYLTARDDQATVEFDLSDLITIDDFDWVEAKDTNTPRSNTASVQDEAIDFVLKRDEWL